jgi:hypothetical protein
MVREAILKAVTHTTLILFMALVALLPLHMVLQLQLNQTEITKLKN